MKAAGAGPRPYNGRARLIQRIIQAFSLGVFIWLLGKAAGPTVYSWLPPDLFLRLDPLAATAVPLAARQVISALIPGLILLVVAAVFGRVFCGYLCPMGATLDAAGWLARLGRKDFPKTSFLNRTKYLLLAVVLGAALFGVNLVFWLAPMPLVTRFYAQFLHPLLLWVGSLGLDLGRPALESLGLVSQYTTLSARAFDGLYIIIFFAALIILERVRPRFWCGFLCPAGALLGLISFRPAWRRRVEKCVGCGRCARQCPTRAISDDGLKTRHEECITCRACQDVCPVGGVEFSFSGGLDKSSVPVAPALIVSRRAFLRATGIGVLLAGYQYLNRPTQDTRLPLVVRPPGSIPEDEFLVKCLRCGECLKACPTNGLSLTGLESELRRSFSPYLLARRGPCEPDCNACGRVCPTRAIRPLPLEEKKWAKMGTAVVIKETCLAWAEDRRCVVCQEVCPYAAIDLVQESGLQAPVPVVDSARCYGCGYCEFHCPVEKPAIVAVAEGALRLNEGSFVNEAKTRGLDLDPDQREHDDTPDDQLPPGFILD